MSYVFNNNYQKDYVSKSQINRKLLNEMGVSKKVSVTDAKNLFRECNRKIIVTGNENNEYQQRRTFVVLRSDLKKKISQYNRIDGQ